VAVCLDTASPVDNQAGVDSAWEQEKLEATLREMLDCEACRTPRSGSPQRPGHALLGNLCAYQDAD